MVSKKTKLLYIRYRIIFVYYHLVIWLGIGNYILYLLLLKCEFVKVYNLYKYAVYIQILLDQGAELSSLTWNDIASMN